MNLNDAGSLGLAMPQVRGWSKDGLVGRMFRYGLILVLFVSLFNLPLRYFITGREAAPIMTFALQVALFCFVLMTFVVSRPLRFVRYDIIVGFFLLYSVFHAILALGQEEELIYTIRELRTHFYGFMVYYVARYYLQETRDFLTISRYLRLAIIVSCGELLYEIISVIFFGLSVDTVVPWVSILEEVSDVSWLRKAGNWYFPSLFGLPHAVGMLAAMGVALFYADYRVTGHRRDLVWVTFCFFMAFVATSRVFVFATALVTVSIAMVERRRVARSLPKLVLGAVLVSLAVFSILIWVDEVRVFMGAYWVMMRNQTLQFVMLHSDEVNLVPAPTAGIGTNLFYYLFGVGVNVVDAPSDVVGYIIYGITDIRLIILVLSYGFVYLLLWALTASLLIAVRKDKILLLYAIGLIPFYASMIHYMEVFKMMVFPVFAFLYAWLVTAWDMSRRGEQYWWKEAWHVDE